MPTLFGVDTSVAQQDYNLAGAVANDGVQFIIAKAGGSDDGIYIDSQFRNTYQKAKSLGIPIGLYWYTKASSVSALQTEISYLISEIQGMQFELPLYLDLEETSLYSIAGDLAQYWNSTLINLRYYPGIYSMYSWFYDVLNIPALTQYSIWLAYWVNTQPSFQWNYDVWQQGARTIGGVNTDYDWLYTDYSFIQTQGYNGFSGGITYTVRNTSPEGLYLPWYMTIGANGYNTSIVGHSADGLGVTGANVLNNCVGYSQGRMMEMYNEAISPINSASQNIFSMFNANAEDWYQIAINNNFPVGSTPNYGAVGVWYSPSQNVGHVANCEDLINGSWLISEGHWQHGGTYGSWDTTYLLSDYTLPWMDSSWQLIGFIYPFTASPHPPIPPTPTRGRKLKPWMMLRNPTLF